MSHLLTLIAGYGLGMWVGASIAAVVYRSPAPEADDIRTVWGRF